jgi:hypothetical protein
MTDVRQNLSNLFLSEIPRFGFKAFNSATWRVTLRRDRVTATDATERVPPVDGQAGSLSYFDLTCVNAPLGDLLY